MMRILHYIPSIDESSGGVGAYMQLLSRDLGARCELHVVTHRSAKMLTLENCELHFIPLNKNPFTEKSKREFLELLVTIQPDVFHTNCCWMPQSARTAIWAKRAGYKVVYTPHGMLEPWIMQRHYWTKKKPAILLFQKLGIQMADIIHATAESEKTNLLALGWNKKIRVIPNCVRVDEIELKQSWERKKNILFLSRVHVKKGINFLIEAVAMLNVNVNKDVNDNQNQNDNENENVNVRSTLVASLAKNVNEDQNDNENENENVRSTLVASLAKNVNVSLNGYTITIAGMGEEAYVDELKRMAERLGVADMFRFIGPVHGEEKWKLYQQADVFVLPTHSENFGIVVAEALASGTPVITTTGTPWEELNTHHCGWWVPVGTQSLVEALKEFLRCKDNELESMGKQGRMLIEKRYSCETTASLFLKLYNEIV